MRSQGLLPGSLSMRSRGAAGLLGGAWSPARPRSRKCGVRGTHADCLCCPGVPGAARGCPASARERPRRPGAAGLGRGSRVVPDLRGRVRGGLCGPRPAAPRAPHQVHLLLPRLWRQLQQSLEARRSSVQAHGGGNLAADARGQHGVGAAF